MTVSAGVAVLEEAALERGSTTRQAAQKPLYNRPARMEMIKC